MRRDNVATWPEFNIELIPRLCFVDPLVTANATGHAPNVAMFLLLQFHRNVKSPTPVRRVNRETFLPAIILLLPFEDPQSLVPNISCFVQPVLRDFSGECVFERFWC
jgi:hypothetical protein